MLERAQRVLWVVFDFLFLAVPLVLLALDTPLLSPAGWICLASVFLLVVCIVGRAPFVSVLLPRLLSERPRWLVRSVHGFLGFWAVTLIVVLGLNLLAYRQQAYWVPALELKQVPQVQPAKEIVSLPPLPSLEGKIYLPPSLNGVGFDSFALFGGTYLPPTDHPHRYRHAISVDVARRSIQNRHAEWIAEGLDASILLGETFPKASWKRLSPYHLVRWNIVLIVRDIQASGFEGWSARKSEQAGDWVLEVHALEKAADRSYVSCSVERGVLGLDPKITLSGLGLSEAFCSFENPELQKLFQANRSGADCPACRASPELLPAPARRVYEHLAALEEGRSLVCDELFQELKRDENVTSAELLYALAERVGGQASPTYRACYCAAFESEKHCSSDNGGEP